MSALNLRLPASIHRHIREIARRDGVSINLFITSAVTEKISALTTEEYIAARARKARKGPSRRCLIASQNENHCPAMSCRAAANQQVQATLYSAPDLRRCADASAGRACQCAP